METLRKRSLFVLTALLAITTLHAQTADDIVNKYVTAVGGKDVINNVKSLIIENTVSIPAMSIDMTSTTTIVVGKGYKSESEYQGNKIIQCISDKGGWAVNPMMGAATPTAMPDDQVKAMKLNLQVDPLANYAANGYKVELLGKDSADYKLKMTGTGVDVTYYINMKTYLIDKVVSHSAEAETTITFSDYRKTDAGLFYPYATTLDLPQISLSMATKKVTVNPTVDPTAFDMPK
ncbi:MAG TPA: hypothetical protein VFE32_04335 [Puia sp.]|jgi:hypothetical protein|nr:hypothetical protein [Puia sp.]